MVGRLILLPGLGCGARLLEPQRAAMPWVETPDWPVMERGISLAEYSRRMAEAIQSGRSIEKGGEPTWVGGVSLGAMVAMELGRLLPVRGVIQIAGCRSGRSVTRWLRWSRWAGPRVPAGMLRSVGWLGPMAMGWGEGLGPRERECLRAAMSEPRVDMLRAAGPAIFEWEPEPIGVPIHAIHGEKDRVIPVKRVNAEEVVPGAGHVMNLSHAEAVNRFIGRVMGG